MLCQGYGRYSADFAHSWTCAQAQDCLNRPSDAVVAQWQSTPLVRVRSRVQSSLTAPFPYFFTSNRVGSCGVRSHRIACCGEPVVFLHCLAGGLGGAFESANRIVFCIVPAGAGEVSVQAQLLILGTLAPLTAILSDIVMAPLGHTVTKSINENTCVRLIMAWI